MKPNLRLYDIQYKVYFKNKVIIKAKLYTNDKFDYLKYLLKRNKNSIKGGQKNLYEKKLPDT